MKSALLFLASGLLWLAALPAQGFERISIDAGGPIHDRILADFDGDSRTDVLLVMKDGRLVFFLQERNGSGFSGPRRARIAFRPAALAVANLVPPAGAEIILLSARGAHTLSPVGTGALEPRPLVEAELIFSPGYDGLPRFWAWGSDLDGDGRDDLLLPGLASDLILFGTPPGKNPRPLMPVEAPAETSLEEHPRGALEVRLQRPRVAFERVLTPRAPSPVFFRDRRLFALPGSARKGYSSHPRTLLELHEDPTDPMNLLQRLDVSFSDLDGDGLADALVARTRVDATARVLEQRTQLLFFRGGGAAGAPPRQVIVLGGVLSGGARLRDLDGDGRLDLLVSVFGGGVTANIARLVLRSVKLEYHFYPGTPGKRPFTRSPALTLVDHVPLSIFDRWDLRHRLFADRDWTGDGFADLLRIESDGEEESRVTLRAGRRGESGIRFQEKPLAALRLPKGLLGYQSRSLAGDRPALFCWQAERLFFITFDASR